MEEKEEKTEILGTATVTTRGRITVPKTIRDRFGFKPGCEVDFDINSKGDIIMKLVEE
ncbi:AbrB/MazE/SpoVT family DNA-binding domain-containing protein [Devosia geojensis]|uniref:AbrB/MazE/SpoVT family DNA-binding domain-containing protein n=1 Tax=Devosia geojensis TaxID=443610 RepID=UPI0009FBD6C9|nr:AbrB/MazE/SpoVT family DNA-binding domain-containing protein [Devosia geojensis]